MRPGERLGGRLNWKLESRDNGTQTFVTYYLFTDPGGAIPGWVANRANTTAVPNVLLAVRRYVISNRATP